MVLLDDVVLLGEWVIECQLAFVLVRAALNIADMSSSVTVSCSLPFALENTGLLVVAVAAFVPGSVMYS